MAGRPKKKNPNMKETMNELLIRCRQDLDLLTKAKKLLKPIVVPAEQ